MRQEKDFIKTPIYIISSIVSVLRQYFGTEGRIALEYSKYKYEVDQKKSNIWISEEFNDNRSVMGKRPCVLVSFPQMSFPQNVIGDTMIYMPDNAEVRNIGMTNGQIRLRCISEKALSSVELATEVKYFISVFRKQIECAHKIDLIRPSSIVGPQRIEEYKEYWTTDVVCDIVYQENWAVFIEELRVKSININLNEK